MTVQKDLKGPSAQVTGVLLLLGAAVLWSLSGAFIKLVVEGNAAPHGMVIAMYRSLVAGLFLVPLARGRWSTLLVQGSMPEGRRRIRPAALSCMVFFTIMTCCYVISLTLTEAGSAIILQYTSTFWILLLSPWLVGERPDRRDRWAVTMALAGILTIFLAHPGGNAAGLIIALVSGLFYGLLTLMLRRLRNCDSAAVSVLNNLGSAVILLPVVAVGGWILDRPDLSLAVSARVAGLLMLLGVVQFGIPYYLYTLGLARVPAYHAGLITMIEPVLVPVWAFLAVGERLPPSTFVGGAMILGALGLRVLLHSGGASFGLRSAGGTAQPPRVRKGSIR